MNYLNTVPLEALDHFYFKQVLNQIPPPLRRWAEDLLVLRGGQRQQQINSLKQLYPSNYLFLPWILDDVFTMPETVRLTIGQGHTLLLISMVILDQLVDGQTPHVQESLLVQQHLSLEAQVIFGKQFKTSAPFWKQYRISVAKAIAALTLEFNCVRNHTPPYTFALMQQVCLSKAAILRLLTHALALSGKSLHLLPVVNESINQLVFADQLTDDALDWREDYQSGRYTLPVVLAANTAGESLAEVARWGSDKLEARLERDGLLVFMAEQSVAVLAEALDDLSAVGLSDTKLANFLSERHSLMQRQVRYRNALRVTSGLLQTFHK